MKWNPHSAVPQQCQGTKSSGLPACRQPADFSCLPLDLAICLIPVKHGFLSTCYISISWFKSLWYHGASTPLGLSSDKGSQAGPVSPPWAFGGRPRVLVCRWPELIRCYQQARQISVMAKQEPSPQPKVASIGRGQPHDHPVREPFPIASPRLGHPQLHCCWAGCEPTQPKSWQGDAIRGI